MSHTKDGDTVILVENSEKASFSKLRSNGTVRAGKSQVPANALIGAPWGALFELSGDGRSLIRVESQPSDGITRVTETEKNNSGLNDDNTNQKLTQADIKALKETGMGGNAIVDALCSNSATFSAKTEFAQDKYKKKKAKKYCTYVTLRKPTARSICQAYFDKDPERIHNMRPDSLAILLSLANVGAGEQVLVLESCMGVVGAAVAERLGGFGRLVSAGLDKPAQMDAVNSLNLSPEQRACVSCSYLSELQDTAAAAAIVAAAAATAVTAIAGGAEGAAVSPVEATTDPLASRGVSDAPASSAAQSTEVADSSAVSEAGKRADLEEAYAATAGESTLSAERKARQEILRTVGGGNNFVASLGTLAHVANTGFSSCVLACPKVDPSTLLAEVFPLLRNSATFAVYSSVLQPLAEAAHMLTCSKQAVMVSLQESWFRPYQVLPARTHPTMTCAGTGGYILSGIKVQRDTNARPLSASNAPSSSHAPAPAPSQPQTEGNGSADAGDANIAKAAEDLSVEGRQASVDPRGRGGKDTGSNRGRGGGRRGRGGGGKRQRN